MRVQDLIDIQFLSTPSARRATKITAADIVGGVFLSTPSARRATRDQRSYLNPIHISIHALREEGDAIGGKPSGAPGDFYPRPPRGGRPDSLTMGGVAKPFLSTPSARRATFFE